MATPEEIMASIDAQAAPILTAIQSSQAAYLSSKNRYFQGLPTHGATPEGGASAMPDRLSSKPEDQLDGWTDFGVSLGDSLPMALQIDTYDGPGGKGYTVRLSVVIASATWERRVSFGPEDRGHAWRQMDQNT